MPNKRTLEGREHLSVMPEEFKGIHEGLRTLEGIRYRHSDDAEVIGYDQDMLALLREDLGNARQEVESTTENREAFQVLLARMDEVSERMEAALRARSPRQAQPKRAVAETGDKVVLKEAAGREKVVDLLATYRQSVQASDTERAQAQAQVLAKEVAVAQKTEAEQPEQPVRALPKIVRKSPDRLAGPVDLATRLRKTDDALAALENMFVTGDFSQAEAKASFVNDNLEVEYSRLLSGVGPERPDADRAADMEVVHDKYDRLHDYLERIKAARERATKIEEKRQADLPQARVVAKKQLADAARRLQRLHLAQPFEAADRKENLKTLGDAETALSKAYAAIDKLGGGDEAEKLTAQAEAMHQDLRVLQAEFGLLAGPEKIDLEPVDDRAEWETPITPPPRAIRATVEIEGNDDLAQAARPTTSLLARTAAAFGRLPQVVKGFGSYLTSGWKEASEQVVKEEVKGTLAPYETGEAEKMTKKELAVRLTAGAFEALLTTGAGAILPDALRRYVSQEKFTKKESERLVEAIERLGGKEAAQSPGATGEGFEAWSKEQLDMRAQSGNNLSQEMATSEYLSAKLKKIFRGLEKKKLDFEDIFSHELGELIGQVKAEVQPRVAAGKVRAEAMNTAMVASGLALGAEYGPTALAGVLFLRGPAYALASLREQMVGVRADITKTEARDPGQAEVFKQTVAQAFTSTYRRLRGQAGANEGEQSLNRVRALTTLGRAFGLTATTLGAAGYLYSNAGEIDIDAVLNRATERVEERATPADTQARTGEASPENSTPWTAPEDGFSVPPPEPKTPEIVGPPAPEPDTRPVFFGPIPTGSEIQRHEGITQVLQRVILEASLHPERGVSYGYNPDSGLDPQVFAKRMALQLAKSSDFLDLGLNEAAIGKINIVPDSSGYSWGIAFVNNAHEKMSVEELKRLGYVYDLK